MSSKLTFDKIENMSKKNKDLIVRLSNTKLILLYVGTFVVFEAIFFFSFTIGNLLQNGQLDLPFFIYTPFLMVLAVILCIISIKNTYYILNDSRVIHVRLGKEVSYEWSHIVYINEEWSQKHKTLDFFLESGKECFLAFDKDGKLYEHALRNCRLLEQEEFLRRYTKNKL